VTRPHGASSAQAVQNSEDPGAVIGTGRLFLPNMRRKTMSSMPAV